VFGEGLVGYVVGEQQFSGHFPVGGSFGVAGVSECVGGVDDGTANVPAGRSCAK